VETATPNVKYVWPHRHFLREKSPYEFWELETKGSLKGKSEEKLGKKVDSWVLIRGKGTVENHKVDVWKSGGWEIRREGCWVDFQTGNVENKGSRKRDAEFFGRGLPKSALLN